MGFVVVWGMPSASKGKRPTRKSQAEKVFDKYPHTEWADNALEEVMKMRK
ncbi:unnamed protein product [marine sediment metagenome]|uniref:Uncharacterized protein n=1 Tax=marine sediment metagenome TaxID=412755 RepID=X1VR03_9ZZZZ